MNDRELERDTFVSYASSYDLYVGRNDIGDLTSEQQDELIKETLAAEGDSRSLVVEWNVKKSQAEGLWVLIIIVGSALEHAGRIRDFMSRDEKDIQEIVAFFTATKLGLRLEEAYPPFDFREKRTEYDWSELESVRMESLTIDSSDSLMDVKEEICNVLKSEYTDISKDYIDRIPFHVFERYYKDGKLELIVDKGLSSMVARSGILPIKWPSIFAMMFTALIIAFIPIWIFFGAAWGLLALIGAFICKSLSTQMIVSGVRSFALKDKNLFRLFLARHIVWVRAKPIRR